MRPRTKRQKQYWIQRESPKRLVLSEKIGEKGVVELGRIFNEALRNVNKEISKVYTKYAAESGLSVDELALILNRSEKTKFLASIRRAMKRLGFKLGDVYKPDYLRRLSRLDAIKEQIYWQIAELSIPQEKLSTKTYTEILQSAYRHMQGDLEYIGIAPSFQTIDTEVVAEILKSRWVGSNYSSRIWKNTRLFARQVRTILGGALSTGTSYQKTARLIRERFGVSNFVATRLIRTETNYFHNQAELQAYGDDGIKRYQFDAVMDGRTSKVCQDHNGKVYYLKDKVVGENYPPLHPNCRSTTFPILASETRYKRKRQVRQ